MIFSIAQTKDGFLYFGTANGLSRFDGKNFLNYSTHDGLPNNVIRKVLPLKKRKLLIGSFGGLSILGDEFKNYTTADGLINDSVYTIAKHNKLFYIGTRRGISLFNGSKFLDNFDYKFFNDKKIYAFEFDKKNIIYIATNKGLYKIENDSTSLLGNLESVFSLELTDNGTLWIGSINGGFKYENSSITKIKGLKNSVVYYVKEDNQKQIWFGTDNGLVKKNNDNYFYYTISNNFLSKNCYSIFQDDAENLWLGTNHGTFLFDDGKFLLYDRRFGIPSSTWDLIQLSNGDIWVGTDGNGVLSLKGNKFNKIPYLKNIPTTIWSIFEDEKNGDIWFATSGGTSKLDKNHKVTNYNSSNGFTDDMILAINSGQNDDIWFSSYSKGVFLLKDGVFHNIQPKNAKNSPVFGNIKGFDNDIWFFSNSGLDRIKDGNEIDFPSQNILNSYSYYSASVDRKNNYIILGTYERGLIIYNPNESNEKSIVKIISHNDGLTDNAVLFTMFDNESSILWIGTNKGLNKFYYQKFLATGEVIVKAYNEYDGIPSYECDQMGAMVDSEGNFWFSTAKGVAKYNKAKERRPKSNSIPFISSIEINYKNIELSNYGEKNCSSILGYSEVEFPYYMNNITFYFSAIYFANPLDVEFKYRLIGANSRFSPLTKNNYVTFSSLPPGKYTFELLAYTKESQKFSAPVKFSFVIKTPFWKSTYFYLFILFSLLLGIYIIHRIRTAAIRKKNIELIKLYQENISYQQQLIESERDYKGLFENAHNAMLISHPKTLLIIDANNSAENLYGYSKNELINMSTKVLSSNPQETKELFTKVVENGIVRKFQTTHLKKDGSEIILNINAGLTNYKGIKAVISVHRDITEEEEIKKQLLLAKEAAIKSNKLKSEFLAQISHEIRTPINTVLGFLSLLQDLLADNENDDIQSLFPPIRRSSKRIIRTVDLILNMSEVNAGTFELNIQEIHIADILEELIIEQKQNAKNNGLDLQLINNIGDASIFVDEYTFTQIFVNLIDNAIKYTNEGSIQVILSKTDSSIIVEVKDTGIGMSEEYIPHVFDAFSQEEQGYTRKYEGNGLGLALVKNYVEINKGTISLESTKGIGTTFRVEFSI